MANVAEAEEKKGGAGVEKVGGARQEAENKDPFARLEAMAATARSGTRAAKESAVATVGAKLGGVESAGGTATDRSALEQQVAPGLEQMEEIVTETDRRVDGAMGESGPTAGETTFVEVPRPETAAVAPTTEQPNEGDHNAELVERQQKYEARESAERSLRKAVREGKLDEALQSMTQVEELSKATGYEIAGLYVVKESLARELLGAKRYDEAMAMAESAGGSNFVEYVRNSIDSDNEKEAFAGMFAEEASQLEALKSSAESAGTLEDLEAALKAAESLRNETIMKLNRIETEKGLTLSASLDGKKSNSLHNLIVASKWKTMDDLMTDIRGKMGAEVEKVTEAFMTELNSDFEAVAKNFGQTLKSAPETGNLEGLGLEDLRSKLGELTSYQQKVDGMKFDAAVDAVRDIEDKRYKFEKKMRSLEDQGIRVRFKIGEGSGYGNKAADLWRRVDKDGSYERAMDKVIELKEKAPTLVAPQMETVRRAIDKIFGGYDTKIAAIDAEYQRNNAAIEAEERGTNEQIAQLEASKGMFNKGKIEAQVAELRKGLGKLEAAKDQARVQIKALEGEMDGLDAKTNGAYKDKFDALARRRTQVWNSI